MSIGSRFIYLVFALLCVVTMGQVQNTRPAPFNTPNTPPTPAATTSAWNIRAYFNNLLQKKQATDCQWKDPKSGTVVDFSKLRKSGTDYVGEDATYRYFLNFCGTPNIGGYCSQREHSICQFSKMTSSFIAGLGSFTRTPNPTYTPINGDIANGLTVSMHNGDICWMNGRQVPRSVNINLKCGSGNTMTVAEVPGQCTHNIELITSDACFSSGMISWGSLFFITIFLVAVYVVGGCYYNVKFNGMEWGKLETVPQWTFWKEVPTYTMEGGKWAYNKFEAWRTGNEVQYQRVAGDDHDEEDKDNRAVVDDL